MAFTHAVGMGSILTRMVQIKVTMIIDQVSRGIAVTFERIEHPIVSNLPVPARHKALIAAFIAVEINSVCVKLFHQQCEKPHLIAYPLLFRRLSCDSGGCHGPCAEKLHPPFINAVFHLWFASPSTYRLFQ